MKLKKLQKVSDAITVHRYEDGWMVEVTGRDVNDDWKTIKLVCTTETQLIELLKEYNQTTLDN